MADPLASGATSPGGAAAASSYLRVTPDKEITFSPPFTAVSKRSLVVANTHPTAPAAFKIKTTAPKQYCVRPNSGRVAAGSSVEVQVMLQALKEDAAAAAPTKSKDKFLVQYISLPADVMQLEGDELASRLAELWAQAEQLKKTSPDAASSVLTEKKLRCVFAAEGAGGVGGGEDVTGTTASRRRSSSAAPYQAEFADASDASGAAASAANTTVTAAAAAAPLVSAPRATALIPTDAPPAYNQPTHPHPPAPAPAPAPSASIAQVTVRPTPLPAAPATVQALQPQPQPPSLLQQTHQPDFPSAATLKELLAAREKVKTLQAACEGYKAEIGRLSALRQRRNDTAAAMATNANALAAMKIGGGLVLAKEEGMTLQVLVLVALASFVVGVFFF
ncbi:phosphatidylinositol-binding protein scs2 [Geranomyces michiganensis]|nr:phosphatidylinositol-binding protein scs2 [Geranomyces michiganensis]